MTSLSLISSHHHLFHKKKTEQAVTRKYTLSAMNVSVFSAKLIIAISSGHTIQKNYLEIKFTYDYPRLVDVQIIDLKIQ